jgi:hypothetical protein
MRSINYLLLLLLPPFFACVQDRNRSGQTMGYVPVYLPAATSHQISSGAPVATKNAGKIYAYQNYLFQVEQGQGIHIIDNSVPQQATKVAFINVPGCSEIAIKSNHLYTNNVNDLVVLSLANITAPALVSRQQGAFPQLENNYPPQTGVFFECVDPAKGIVIGWEQKMLSDPKCRR